jgi:hypothetical protein
MIPEEGQGGWLLHELKLFSQVLEFDPEICYTDSKSTSAPSRSVLMAGLKEV